jgi:hypothetical protein
MHVVLQNYYLFGILKINSKFCFENLENQFWLMPLFSNKGLN